MFSRKSKTAVVEREVSRTADTVSDLADRAVEVAGHAAERAASAAREATRVAKPVVRRTAHTAAESLSEAAERAAEVLAGSADRLATSEASATARERLADRAEAFAQAVRPRRRRRLRKLLFVGAFAGTVVAVVKSGLPEKLRAKFHPEDVDEEPEAITLPARSTGYDHETEASATAVGDSSTVSE